MLKQNDLIDIYLRRTEYCQFLGYPKVIMEQIMDGLSSQENMIFTKPLNNLYGHNGN